MDSIDVAVSFDTTGSMYPCLTQVRREVSNMVKQLFADIPGLRVAVIAHGDYCDRRSTYVTKQVDFSSDQSKIVKFINGVGATGGGDSPECYELVLHEARDLDWQSTTSKVLIMIGDDVPHGPSYSENTKNLDWRKEIEGLMKVGVNVYGVQALNRRHAKSFYDEIARKTGGFHLSLDQFSTVRDLIMAICYKQVGNEQLDSWEQQVIKAGRMNRGLDTNFGILSGKIERPTFVDDEPERYEYKYVSRKRSKSMDTSDTRYTTDRPLEAVDPSRFQILNVDHGCVIKDFVNDNGLLFKAGRGFYEFTKAETVQAKKEIVLVENITGDMFTGEKAREMLSLPIGASAKTRYKVLPGYTTYVQSTSYNRKLVGGTKFLYEVDMSR